MSAQASRVTTPATLFQSWMEACRLPLLCEFVPTIQNPVLTVQIGTIDGMPVHAYGALGRFSCAYWWEHWSLDRTEAFARAWKYLPREIRKYYQYHKAMGSFLAEVAPKCPLCLGNYDRSQAVLHALLTSGHVQLACECEHGKSGTSELLRELRQLRSSALSRVLPPEEWHRVVELMIGQVVIGCMSVSAITERITLSFFEEAFHAAKGQQHDAAYVWPRTKAAILKRQEDECRAKSSRDELLRLRFRWNPGRLRWTAQSPLNERLTYVLPPDHSLTSEGWYYCLPLADQKGGSQWTVLVEVIHPVPARHLSRLVPSSTKSLFRPR